MREIKNWRAALLLGAIVAVQLIVVHQNTLHISDVISVSPGDERRVQTKAVFVPKPARNDRPTLYCMVPTVYLPEKLKKWHRILQTWGPRCDVVKFFVDADAAAPNEFSTYGLDRLKTKITVEVVHINMTRKINDCHDDSNNSGQPCKQIWEKMWRSWVWILDHDINKAQFFLKVDDDTYLIPKHVRDWLVIKKVDYRVPRYLGHWTGHAKKPLVAGACVVFSRAAVAKMAFKFKSMPREFGSRTSYKHGRCVDREGATEEVTTSICLHELGIEAEGMYDENMSEMVMIYHPAAMLYKHRSANKPDWYWTNKPLDVGQGKKCCSLLPAAIHSYKNPDSFVLLDLLLLDESVGPRVLKERRRAKRIGKPHPTIAGNKSLFEAAYFRELEYWVNVSAAIKERYHDDEGYGFAGVREDARPAFF